MRLDTVYKTYGHRDVSHIADILLSLPQDYWYIIPQGLQKIFSKEEIDEIIRIKKIEAQVGRILMRSTEEDYISNRFKARFNKKSSFTYENFNNYVGKLKNNFIDAKLNEYTDVIVNELEQQFDGCAGVVLYAKMAPGRGIGSHIDPGYYTAIVHRLHLPILTNDQVEFTIADTTFNMKTGIIYEIDNQVMHGVTNKGPTDRIHLIIDIIPKDKMPG